MIKIGSENKLTYRGDKLDIWAVGIMLYWLMIGIPPFYVPFDDHALFAAVEEGTWSMEVPLKHDKMTISEEAIMLI